MNDETERAIALCRSFIEVSEKSAASIRKVGEYTTGGWITKRRTHVRPGYEREAQKADHCIATLNYIIEGLRKGWDPRRL